MPNGYLQNRLVRSVINRKRAVDFWDLDIAHDAVFADIQLPLVFDAVFLRQNPALAVFGEFLVVRMSFRQNFLVVKAVDGRYRFGIAGDRPGLVKGVPKITDRWVQQQGEPCKKDQNQDYRGQMLFHTVFSLPLCGENEAPLSPAADFCFPGKYPPRIPRRRTYSCGNGCRGFYPGFWREEDPPRRKVSLFLTSRRPCAFSQSAVPQRPRPEPSR